MPWEETKPMESRMKFISEVLKGERYFVDICREFRISPKTGYKWINRFEADGLEGISERPNAPKDFYNKINTENRDLIIKLRKEHPFWGAPKIEAYLSRRHDNIPSVSTIGRVLRMAKLTRPSKPSVFKKAESKLTESERPNHVWSADFKGQFKTKCGVYNYPLTIADHFSRRLIGIHNLRSTTLVDTKKSLTKSFKEHGLPDIIRTDNGTPFTGANGPSQLSVWWIELGIKPELTAKGVPQQNGRHERMHRVLNEEAIDVRNFTFSGQRKNFHKYLDFYNSERPHQGIDNKVPNDIYKKSLKEMPDKIKEYEYPKYVEVRRVCGSGRLQFFGNRYFLSNAFNRKNIGLIPVGDEIWEVNFRGHNMGTINTYYNTFNGVYLGD